MYILKTGREGVIVLFSLSAIAELFKQLMKDMHIERLIGNRGVDAMLWNFHRRLIQGFPTRISIDVEPSQARLTGYEGGGKVMKMVVIEVNPASNKNQTKKRAQPSPKPFEPDESFLDCVDVLDPLCLTLYQKKGA